MLHLIGLALHEEQDDVDRSFSRDASCHSEFKFLEKSMGLTGQAATSSTHKKSSLLSLAKSLASKSASSSQEDSTTTLTKLLSEIRGKVSKNVQVKLLVEWALDYSQRLLKLKHKIDEHKQISEVTPTSSGSGADEQSQKEKRKNQIAERSRAKVMAKLNKMQKNFMENYKELYEETKSLATSSELPQSSIAAMSSLASDVEMT